MPTIRKAHAKMSESNFRSQKPSASPVLNRTQDRQLLLQGPCQRRPLKEHSFEVPPSIIYVVADGNSGFWPLDTETCPALPA